MHLNLPKHHSTLTMYPKIECVLFHLEKIYNYYFNVCDTL